jgi:radical SAM protein with 4Fe4S-binding SPASM domain
MLEIAKEYGNDIRGKFPFEIFLAVPPAVLPDGMRFDQQLCNGCKLDGVLGVLYDGTIRPCHNFIDDDRYVLGSIYEPYDLRLILEKLSGLQGADPLDIKGICSSCLLLSRCMGSCRAQANNDFGGTDAPNWLCQSLYEKGLFPEELLLDGLLGSSSFSFPPSGSLTILQ